MKNILIWILKGEIVENVCVGHHYPCGGGCCDGCLVPGAWCLPVLCGLMMKAGDDRDWRQYREKSAGLLLPSLPSPDHGLLARNVSSITNTLLIISFLL